MIEVSYDEFKKAMELLGKEGGGRSVSIYINGSVLELKTLDSYAHEVTVCLHDLAYNFKPTVTKKDYL